eukprot:scaffold70861_cov32-Tisochrysis_lutea.AAC.4
MNAKALSEGLVCASASALLFCRLRRSCQSTIKRLRGGRPRAKTETSSKSPIDHLDGAKDYYRLPLPVDIDTWK